MKRLSTKLVNGSALLLVAGWSALAVVGTVDAGAVGKAFLWFNRPSATSLPTAVEIPLPPLPVQGQ